MNIDSHLDVGDELFAAIDGTYCDVEGVAELGVLR